jgi:NADPH2:quinone reductase
MTSETKTARAVLIRQYGPPGVLSYEEVKLPTLAPDEVRIKTGLAAVNHTDVEIRAGKWPVRKPDPFPYIPGVEVVGTIDAVGESVRDLHPGDPVITMMQGLGGVRALRDGGYAEYTTVSSESVALIPVGVDHQAMAALGLAAVTAYEGLRRIGSLSGMRIVVTGAAGGVGSVATAIAHAQHATVVGVVSKPHQIDYVRSLGADEVVVTGAPAGKSLWPAQSLDGVLDTVGGDLFNSCVAGLKAGGTLSLVGAVGGALVRFDAYELIRPVVLTGYSSETLDGEALRAAIKVLGELILQGAIKSPLVRTLALANAAQAHALLEQRGLSGRILLVP